MDFSESMQSIQSNGKEFTVSLLEAKQPSCVPAKEELDARIEMLEIVLRLYSHVHQNIVGIGHSIGGTLLLALAGGKALTYAGQQANLKGFSPGSRTNCRCQAIFG